MSGASRLLEMIDELNEYVDGTLSITHYYKHWELSSYRPGSLFESRTPCASTFNEVVSEAYKIMCEDKKAKANVEVD